MSHAAATNDFPTTVLRVSGQNTLIFERDDSRTECAAAQGSFSFRDDTKVASFRLNSARFVDNR
jgi:hypothetical protein